MPQPLPGRALADRGLGAVGPALLQPGSRVLRIGGRFGRARPGRSASSPKPVPEKCRRAQPRPMASLSAAGGSLSSMLGRGPPGVGAVTW